MMFKKCAKQFNYFYHDDESYKQYNQVSGSDALIKGQLFHNGADNFFDVIKKQENWTLEFFKSAVKSPHKEVQKWLEWFAEQEWNRWIATRVESLDPKAEFMPVAKELQITMPDVIDRTGHVDRIDKVIGKKELQIVEYKTGKSYNLDKTWAATSMNAEIGFYVQILNAINYYPGYKIKEWKVINPTLETIWINKISPVSLKAVEKTFSTIVESIDNKGPFERTVSPLCRYCPYVEDCLFSDEIDILGEFE